MFNISKYFKLGKNNSITLLNNGSFSHNGPYISVFESTLLDRWHIGDFSSVEYTLSIDRSQESKEFIKLVVTATTDTASIIEYARNSTVSPLITVNATVNESFVDIILTPTAASNVGSKVIYTANYFSTQTPPSR